jgi:hypothetical protein
MTSLTTARPCSSAASRIQRRASSPCPWNEYGDVRGLKAPPRRTRAPEGCTDRATTPICSRLSTEQGPAITTTSGPPTATRATLTTVSAGLKVRPTSL